MFSSYIRGRGAGGGGRGGWEVGWGWGGNSSPGEIQRREVELGCRRVGQSFASGFNICFSDIGFVTLLRTAVEISN